MILHSWRAEKSDDNLPLQKKADRFLIFFSIVYTFLHKITVYEEKTPT